MCNFYGFLDRIDNFYFTDTKKIYLKLDNTGRVAREEHGIMWSLAHKIHRACAQLFPDLFAANPYDLKLMFSFEVLREGSIENSRLADSALKQGIAQFFRKSQDHGIFDSSASKANKAYLFNHLIKILNDQERREIVDILAKLTFKDKEKGISWKSADFIEYLKTLSRSSKAQIPQASPLLSHYKFEEYKEVLQLFFSIPQEKRGVILQEVNVILEANTLKLDRLKEFIDVIQVIPLQNLQGIANDYLAIFGSFKTEIANKRHIETLAHWKHQDRVKYMRELISLIRPEDSIYEVGQVLDLLRKIPAERLEGIGKDCAFFESKCTITGLFYFIFAHLEKNVRGVITSEVAKFIPQKIEGNEALWMRKLADELAQLKIHPGEDLRKKITDTLAQSTPLFKIQDNFIDKCRIIIHFIHTPQPYQSHFINAFSEYPEKKSSEIIKLCSLKLFLDLIPKRDIDSHLIPISLQKWISGDKIALPAEVWGVYKALNVEQKGEFIKLSKQYIASFFLSKEDPLTHSMAEDIIAGLYQSLEADSKDKKTQAALGLLKMYKDKGDWDCIDYAVIDILMIDVQPLLSQLQNYKSVDPSE